MMVVMMMAMMMMIYGVEDDICYWIFYLENFRVC